MGDLIFMSGYQKNSLILKFSVVIRICLNAGHSMSFSPLTWWVLSFLENVFEFCVFFYLLYWFSSQKHQLYIRWISFISLAYLYILLNHFSVMVLLSCILSVFITLSTYVLLCFQPGLYSTVLLSMWSSVLQ